MVDKMKKMYLKIEKVVIRPRLWRTKPSWTNYLTRRLHECPFEYIPSVGAAINSRVLVICFSVDQPFLSPS